MEEHLALMSSESTVNCQVIWKKPQQHTCKENSSEVQKENILSSGFPKSNIIIFISIPVPSEDQKKGKERAGDRT